MELVELPLAPAEAELAAEIVIIGNNAGELLDPPRDLARTDRNARRAAQLQRQHLLLP